VQATEGDMDTAYGPRCSSPQINAFANDTLPGTIRSRLNLQ